MNRSMIEVDRRTTPTRYRLLETLRHYATDRLTERGDATALPARHAAWFVDLAERALAAAPDVADPRRLAALDSLEAAALYEGRLADCRDHARQALALAHRHGDDYHGLQARLHDALALIYSDDRVAGLEATLALRAASEEVGNPHHRAWSRYVLAEALGDDDPDGALELLAEALALAEPVGDRFLEGVARVGIASLRARHHSPRDVLSAFPDVIGHWRRAGDWTHQWTTLRNLVPLLVRLDADEPAARLYGAQQTADTDTFGADADRLAEAGETLATRLGTSRFGALIDDGTALDGPGAVDLALASIADVLEDR